jgi:hypothetical protein
MTETPKTASRIATDRRRIRWSSRAHPVGRRSLPFRGADAGAASLVAVLALALTAAIPVSAAPSAKPSASPAPMPTVDWKAFNDRLKQTIQSKQLPGAVTPMKAQHVELTVETNRKGEVTRVRSGKGATDEMFNAMTYGNALQAYIRTEDGRSIPGTYKLTYDYSPDTKKVRRTVELVREGGVNPDAVGAVEEMSDANRKRMQLDQKLIEDAMKKGTAVQMKPAPLRSPTPRPKKT